MTEMGSKVYVIRNNRVEEGILTDTIDEQKAGSNIVLMSVILVGKSPIYTKKFYNTPEEAEEDLEEK